MCSSDLFPSHDRGAISIARRVQDPLAELVKIDPESIGVGMYQHDINQGRLKEALGDVVESAVNNVGVNVNSASWALLGYVSGINKNVAKNIVEYRNQNGNFKSRNELKKVKGLGEKADWSRSYRAHGLSVWYISIFSFSCFSFCYWLITTFFPFTHGTQAFIQLVALLGNQ